MNREELARKYYDMEVKLYCVDSLKGFTEFMQELQALSGRMIQEERDIAGMSAVRGMVGRLVRKAAAVNIQLRKKWTMEGIGKKLPGTIDFEKLLKAGSRQEFLAGFEKVLTPEQKIALSSFAVTECLFRLDCLLLEKYKTAYAGAKDISDFLVSAANIFKTCFENPLYFNEIGDDVLDFADKVLGDYETSIREYARLTVKMPCVPMLFREAESYAITAAGVNFARGMKAGKPEYFDTAADLLTNTYYFYSTHAEAAFEEVLKFDGRQSLLSFLELMQEKEITLTPVQDVRSLYQFEHEGKLFLVSFANVWQLFVTRENMYTDADKVIKRMEGDLYETMIDREEFIPVSEYANQLQRYAQMSRFMELDSSMENLLCSQFPHMSADDVNMLITFIKKEFPAQVEQFLLVGTVNFIASYLLKGTVGVKDAIQSGLAATLIELYSRFSEHR